METGKRKKVAIWLVEAYFGVFVLTALLGTIYIDVLYSEGYSIEYLNFLFFIIPLFIRGGLLAGGVFILGQLLNKVTRCFFYKSVVGLAVLPFITSWISLLGSYNDAMFTSFVSFVIALFSVILLMSGAGMIRQNLSVDADVSSKLRLFQTGVVLNIGELCIYNFIGYIGLDINILFPSLLCNIINWIGTICITWGLIGIIKSGLIGENRKEEGGDKISGGWLSRPVSGAVCFLTLWLFFVLFLIPEVCNFLNIELW